MLFKSKLEPIEDESREWHRGWEYKNSAIKIQGCLSIFTYIQIHCSFLRREWRSFNRNFIKYK